MVITSLDNDRIKGYIKLKDRKNRKKTNTFIVEGMHSVLEAYKKGMVAETFYDVVRNTKSVRGALYRAVVRQHNHRT